MLRAGETLGEYEIAARLRSGGMATLYLGRRRGALGFARPVAIKVIHPHLAEDATFVRMFVDEARLCTRIVDPHVVHVEELGDANGTLFLVMEYVHGCSIAEVLRALASRKLLMRPPLAVQIALQIADGLHAAHEAVGEDGHPLGVVHRDVSPQNVLLAYGGHVKVIDFGVAKARGASRLTATGSLRGKIGYMSPEQARGEAVDRRADVYSLGIVLWEMLTMRRLFDAPNELLLLDRVRAANVPRPSEHAPVPPALEQVVMAALARDPDARPATAHELRRRLAAAVPEAHEIDSAQLLAFVTTLMKDELEESRGALPDALRAAIGGELSTGSEELVRTLTREAPAAPTTARVPTRSRRAVALALGFTGALGAAGIASRVVSRSSAAEPPAPVAVAPTPPPASPPEPSPSREIDPAPAADPPASAPRPRKAPPPPRRRVAPPASPAAPPPGPSVRMIDGVPIADKPSF